jgi:hypothetical protein
MLWAVILLFLVGPERRAGPCPGHDIERRSRSRADFGELSRAALGTYLAGRTAVLR